MNKRIDNIEFKFNDGTRPPEIVQYFNVRPGDTGCMTIVFYERDKEGYTVSFVGSRPFSDEIDRNTFWKLLEYGQSICDATFKLDNHD